MIKWIAIKLSCLFKGHKYKRQEIGPLTALEVGLAFGCFDMETKGEDTFVVQHFCENCNKEKGFSPYKDFPKLFVFVAAYLFLLWTLF